MTMALTFSYTSLLDATVDHVIKCGDLHSCVHSTGGQFQGTRTHFPYLRGNSEICSGTGPRQLESLVLLNDTDFLKPEDVYDYMRQLREIIDECSHGTLLEQDLAGDTLNDWQHVTFDTVEAVTIAGQERPFPVRDDCGAGGTTYVMRVTMIWTQLWDEIVLGP